MQITGASAPDLRRSVLGHASLTERDDDRHRPSRNRHLFCSARKDQHVRIAAAPATDSCIARFTGELDLATRENFVPGLHGPMGIPWARTPKAQASDPSRAADLVIHGADDEIRTRDPHLGKRNRRRTPTAAQDSTVRKTVREIRLFRPARIPVYHHTRAMCASACLADDGVAPTDHLGGEPVLGQPRRWRVAR